MPSPFNLLQDQHLLMCYVVDVTDIITVENHLISAYSIHVMKLK